MSRYNQTSAWVAGDQYGPRLLEDVDQDDRDDNAVVHADNATAPVRFFVAAVLMAALILATLWYGVWDWTGWQRGIVITCGSITMMLVYPVILLIGNGDGPAALDILRKWRTKIKRLETKCGMYEQYIGLERDKAEWTRDVEMARIKTDGELASIRAELRVMQDQLHVGPQPNGGVSSPSFVPPRVGRVERMVSDFFVRDLWQRGELNPAIVDPSTGKFVGQVPWSSRGAWNAADTRQAMKIIMEPGAGAPALIVKRQGDNGYYLNLDAYASKGDIINVLGIV